MPNIKSAIKRVSVNEKKKGDNRVVKSNLATTIKKYKALIESGNVAEAEKMYSSVVSTIDSACSKNIIHKANADRKKARLAEMLTKAKAN